MSIGPAVLRVPEEAVAWELCLEPFGNILSLCLLAWWQWPEGRATSEGRPCWGEGFWAEERLPSRVLLLLGCHCLYWALETRAILLSWHLEAFQRKEQAGFLNFTVGLREREELLLLESWDRHKPWLSTRKMNRKHTLKVLLLVGRPTVTPLFSFYKKTLNRDREALKKILGNVAGICFWNLEKSCITKLIFMA